MNNYAEQFKLYSLSLTAGRQTVKPTQKGTEVYPSLQCIATIATVATIATIAAITAIATIAAIPTIAAIAAIATIAATPTNIHRTYLFPWVELPCISATMLRHVCLL